MTESGVVVIVAIFFSYFAYGLVTGRFVLSEYEFDFSGFYDDYLYTKDEGNDEFYGWLCVCGRWEDSCFHCSSCGYEPPWGCDCSFCHERDRERYDDLDDFLWA